MKRRSLNQTIPTWTTAGIFSYLDALAVPWGDEVAAESLDMDYHGNHSGNKRISPLVANLANADGILSSTAMQKLAAMALDLFAPTWEKMYQQLALEYNPIHNYDMTESETESGSNSGSESHTGTDARSITHSTTNSGTDTKTNTGTQTDAHTGTQGVSGTTQTTTNGDSGSEDTIAGFNSTTYQPDRQNETHSSAGSQSTTSQTTTDNLQDQRTDNLTETTQHGHSVAETGSDSLTHGEAIATTGSHSGTRTLTRSGNIGVTTTAQMLEQERILWAWNFFRNVVYKDLDSILTIATY